MADTYCRNQIPAYVSSSASPLRQLLIHPTAPSTRNFLPPLFKPVSSYSSLKTWHKCHFLWEAFPDLLSQSVLLLLTPCYPQPLTTWSSASKTFAFLLQRRC